MLALPRTVWCMALLLFLVGEPSPPYKPSNLFLSCKVDEISIIDYGQPETKIVTSYRTVLRAWYLVTGENRPDSQEPDWEHLYSYRKKRMQALKDCDKNLSSIRQEWR